MLHKIHLITPKILADHLRFLQEEEIIKKEINSINPLRVSYQTTPKGKKILEIIKRIKELHDQESGTNCATRMCSECFWRERGSFQKVRRNSFLLVTTF